MCLGGCARGGCSERSGCHTGLSVLSQSWLEVSCCRWMWRASIVFLLKWLVLTCLTVAVCRSSHCVSSLLFCVHLSSSPVFFLLLQCRHYRIRYLVRTRLLSSSTLVVFYCLLQCFPSIWGLSWCQDACTSSLSSRWHLSHTVGGGTWRWWSAPALLFGWKSGGMWAVLKGPVHHLCWVLICFEDLLQVIPFSNQFGGMANIMYTLLTKVQYR